MKIKPVYLLSKEYVVRKGDMGEEVRDVHCWICISVTHCDVGPDGLEQ